MYMRNMHVLSLADNLYAVRVYAYMYVTVCKTWLTCYIVCYIQS